MSVASVGISVRLLYPFAAALREEGVAEEALLEAAGLSQQLFRNPDARISYELCGRFLRAAITRTKHPALGLEAARHHDAAQFQLFEYFVASSPRIETAIDDLVRYQCVVTDAQVLTIERHGDDVLLRYQPPRPPPRVSVEFVLGSLMLGAVRSLGGTNAASSIRELPILSVHFSGDIPERMLQEYQKFFGPNVRSGMGYNGIWVSSKLARYKTARANPDAHRVLEVQVRRQTEDRLVARPFADRARAVIVASLPQARLSQSHVARALHVSRTTLKRRLATEGTHLRALVAEIRRDIALSALNLPGLSMREIAQRAGYEDPTAFNKAFKRWTGTSPSKHRASQRT